MKFKKLTPIVTTKKINEVKAFYTDIFNFKVIFEMQEQHLSIAADGNEDCEISFMIPAEGQEEMTFPGKGLTYCFEVDNVDAEYDRLKDEGLAIVQPVQDNPWGDRSFILIDPVGIAIYIYQMIPVSEEFKQYFVTEHAAS